MKKECSSAFKNKQSIVKAICLDKFSNEKNLAVESFCNQNYCVDGLEPFCHFHKSKVPSQMNVEDSSVSIILYIFIILALLALLNQAAKSA